MGTGNYRVPIARAKTLYFDWDKIFNYSTAAERHTCKCCGHINNADLSDESGIFFDGFLQEITSWATLLAQKTTQFDLFYVIDKQKSKRTNLRGRNVIGCFNDFINLTIVDCSSYIALNIEPWQEALIDYLEESQNVYGDDYNEAQLNEGYKSEQDKTINYIYRSLVAYLQFLYGADACRCYTSAWTAELIAPVDTPYDKIIYST